jgi:hypothetical protein
VKYDAQGLQQAKNWSMLYGIGLSAVYMAAVLLAAHPPLLQDYPTWVYEGVAFSHLLLGHADPRFALKHYPVPNALSDMALSLLMIVLSWQWAAKVWICIYLVFANFACLRFLASLRDNCPANYFLAPTIAITNLCFWYGFINFQFAVAMMVLFCSVLLRNAMRPWAIGLFLALIFLAHAVPFAVCSLVLLLHIRLTKAYRFLAAYLPSFFLGIWYVYGRFVLAGNREGHVPSADIPVAYMSKGFFAYKVNTYFKSIGYVNPLWHGVSAPLSLIGSVGLLFTLCVVAVLGVTLLYVILMSGRTATAQHLSTRSLWSAIAIIAAIALVCPSEALGIFDPGARLVVCALTLAVLLIKTSGTPSRIVSATSVMLGSMGAVMFVAISMNTLPVATSRLSIPSAFAQFAHVSPAARSHFYSALEHHNMSSPSFDTSLLYNIVKQ